MPEVIEKPPVENLVLRAEYMDANTHCELFDLLNKVPFRHWERIKQGRKDKWTLPVVPHHIAHRRQRYDLVSNLIAVSPQAHQFIHEFEIFGTIACIYVKVKKAEWEAYEYKLASGYHDPLIYVEMHKDVPIEPFKTMARSLLDGVDYLAEGEL